MSIHIVNHLRAKRDYSTLNNEVTAIIQHYSLTSANRFILDYIKKPIVKGDFRDEAVLTQFNENHRKLKNTSIYILLDYRAKNYKQSINEILMGVIQKDKEKRKAERLKMMELMSIDTNDTNNKDIEILNPAQVTNIRD